MNKHSLFFRKLNCMVCGHSHMNCLALRISRSLDEACRALPPGRRCGRDGRDRCGHNCRDGCGCDCRDKCDRCHCSQNSCDHCRRKH